MFFKKIKLLFTYGKELEDLLVDMRRKKKKTEKESLEQADLVFA